VTYKTLLPLPLETVQPLPEPEPVILDLEKAIDSRVSRGTTGCLLWQGTVNQRGLPTLHPDGKTTRSVRRLQYIRYFGPVPAGLVVKTTCFNKRCLEPDHLIARKKAWRAYPSRGQKYPKA
jgi:hypothetical protein